ncbi:MAG: flagellar motor protein MotA [Gammaproteobacteria bacterium]|nr:MAG: flagellar motor protein MotA [Gammaproteobacteria bacterium]
MYQTLQAAANEVADITATAIIEESSWEVIVRFMQEGGTFMYIILMVFIFGLAITIERMIFLTSVKHKNKRVWNEILPFLTSGDFARAQQVTQESNAEIGRILAYGIDQSSHGKRHDDVELAMEEGLMEVMPKLEKRTPYLATFANIATLLGLLGTIMGLISAFTAVANVDPSEKANLLSASISVAMNTTAFGLMAAIPLLLSFSYLQTKTTEIVDSLEMVSVKFINLLRKHQIKVAKRQAKQTKPSIPRTPQSS